MFIFKLQPSLVPLVMSFTVLSLGCASVKKPCVEGGDLSDLPKIKGNRQCLQKQIEGGQYVNDGRFVQWYLNGAVAIEGGFKEGKKHGTWTYFDEQGTKTGEKFFDSNPPKSEKYHR